MHFHRLPYALLFVGQLLVRTSCGFFLGTFFLQQHLTPARYDHTYDDTKDTWWTVAERTPTSVAKTVVDRDIALLIKEIHSSLWHSAPSISPQKAKQKYAELCTIYEKTCSQTLRDGTYDRTEKYLYQWLSIALLQQVDTRLSTKQKTTTTLSELKIYQNDEERRWSAGHTTVKINSKKIPTSREYWEVLTHELGHIVDLGVIAWTSKTKNNIFTEFGKVIRAKDDSSISFYELSWLNETTRKKEASYKDFVSGYAMKWVYEDFAESNNLWFNHNLLFQELATMNPIIAKKYNFFKTVYTNKRFDDNPDSALVAKDTSRPWDTTRIE